MAYVSMLFLFLFLTLNLLSQTLLKTAKSKNIALLISSLIFYIWAGPQYILIIVLLTLIFWFFGLLIQSAEHPSRALLAVPVVLSIGALVFFKYTGFLLGTVQSLFGVPETLPQIVLPLGIAIYTLELISYLTDVYRGDVRAEKRFWMLLLYVSLFHVSLGGPILRYRDVQKGLARRRVRFQDISAGISRFALGLAKKFLLADSLAVLVDQLLVRSNEGLAGVPVTGLLLGVVLSAVKLYLLFSAYADMAIGLGLISGLRYKENFDYPLLSCSLGGFLSKWCISLTDFFRDYVRTPLTENGTRRRFLGTVVSCVLMGLWFGGSWNYVILGLFLAVFLTLEERYFSRLGGVPAGIIGVIGIFLFFFLFSFTTLPRLGIALKGLVGLNHNGFFHQEFFAGITGTLPLILVSICFCLPLGRIIHNLYHGKFQDNLNLMTVASLWETLYPIALIVLTVVYLLRGSGDPFLTF